MKTPFSAATFLASIFLMMLAGNAIADKQCNSGCSKNEKLCRAAVTIQRHGCLSDCKANSAPGPAHTACVQACNAARVAAKKP